MDSKTKSRCQDFHFNIRRRLHSLGQFIYNQQHHEILGRDGKRWSQLAAFYFFFYMTLGGFFCLYLSIYMSVLPLNQPRFIGKDSRLTSRANPLSPGLSFRPQANFDPNDVQTFISLSTTNSEMYTKNLDEFLNVYYNTSNSKKFTINDVGDCNSNDDYGYNKGQPCFLIKINKIVGFIPERNEPESECPGTTNIPVRCMGENVFDQDVLGDVIYYSESGPSKTCGSIDIKHFPYNGKENRTDVYQSPYIWVQFTNLTAHVLISVECRIFGRNLFYDKLAQRASIRFQLYLNKNI